LVSIYPTAQAFDTSSTSNAGDFDVIIGGGEDVRILVEVENQTSYDSRGMEKLKRDVEACSIGHTPVHAGLFIYIQSTERQDTINMLGSLPVACLDNAGMMSSSVLLAIMSLVYLVRQSRSYASNAETSTKKCCTSSRDVIVS